MRLCQTPRIYSLGRDLSTLIQLCDFYRNLVHEIFRIDSLLKFWIDFLALGKATSTRSLSYMLSFLGGRICGPAFSWLLPLSIGACT